MVIKDELLNIELVHNMSIDDVKKIEYKKESERNINTFVVKEILITIYDNPMRVVREFDTFDDGHT